MAMAAAPYTARYSVLLVVVTAIILSPHSQATAEDSGGRVPPDDNNGNNANRAVPDMSPAWTRTEAPSNAVRPGGQSTAKRTSSGSDGNALCDIHPWDTDLHEKISSYRLQGGVQMIKYTLNFRDKEDYPVNPLTTNMSRHFHADRWQTVFTKHGRTLLSLAFNYDALSLLMLTFGVHEIKVDLVDSPPACFGQLTEANKISVIRELLMNDFQAYNEGPSPMGEDEEVCHEVVNDDDGVADFTFECCRPKQDGSESQCNSDTDHYYIDSLYVLMALFKILFLLFGPVVLQKWLYSDPGELSKIPYVIKLNEALRKTLLVKKVQMENTGYGSGQQKEIRQFRKFRELLKSIRSDEVVPIRFSKLHVLVDHHKLMSEKRVPVGLLNFLYYNLLRCGIQKYEPFAACCKQSIFGSWSPRFLWLPLKKQSDCNISCRKFLSWGRLFKLLGGFILVASIPVPYYVRVALYYSYEEEELLVRKKVAEQADLDLTYDHNLFQYLSPTHAILITLYITYCATFVLLGCFRSCDAEKFDDIARGALQDLRRIKRLESIRMVLSHLLLPLEKFGVCGLLVGVVYWPIALPISVFVSVCYCVPTLYLTGRLLLQQRPAFLATRPWPARARINRRTGKVLKQTLSDGTSSFETALLLENISPRDQDRSSSPSKRLNRKCFSCDTEKWGSRLVALFVGLLFVLHMYCLLLMLAECFGVAVEVMVLTLMGTIVNASSAARYVMLAFWIIMYSSNCYNGAYNKYVKLNSKLFSFIKSKLNADVQAVTLFREEKQQNTGFKFFTIPELRRMRQKDIEVDSHSDDDDLPAAAEAAARRSEDTCVDTVDSVDGKLCWTINCLILFVDKKDRPRIPRDLFYRICEIKAPGCPGPVHKSLLKATKQLMYMIVFLIFVFFVVLSFGEFYEISTTNQMLLTLSSGFVPFVVRFVLSPKVQELDLNTYSFSGKIHNIIRTFSQTWPVYDFSFQCWSPDLGGGPFPPGASGGSPGAATAESLQPELGGPHQRVARVKGPDVIDPSHVDLLIKVRDDQYDTFAEHQNLRSEPASLGSRASLSAVQPPRSSPDDPGHGASVAIVNNPTNASLLPRVTAVGEQGPPPTSVRDPPGGAGGARNMRQNPETRRVDLVIDISKGGVQVASGQAQREIAPQGGGHSISMWPMGGATGAVSPTGRETESSL